MTLKDSFNSFKDTINDFGESVKLKTSEKIQHYGLIFLYLEIGGMNFRDEKITNYVENIYHLLRIHTPRSYDLAQEESEELWAYIEMKKRNDRKFKQKLQEISGSIEAKKEKAKKIMQGNASGTKNPLKLISFLKDRINQKKKEVLGDGQ